MVFETNEQFRDYLKKNFIFLYDSNVMNYLRHHNCRYLCKSNHERTGSPFWLYARVPEVEALMEEYRKSLEREVPEVEEF
jgi:hypothetical protein